MNKVEYDDRMVMKRIVWSIGIELLARGLDDEWELDGEFCTTDRSNVVVLYFLFSPLCKSAPRWTDDTPGASGW